MLIYLILLIMGAYLLGSVPSAYLVAKWRRGIDIRRVGSGNVGVTNVLASGTRWTSIIVVLFDFLKGAFPVYLARIIGLPVYQQVLVGLVAICGHNWTVFLRFSGGRGVLTALGVIFALTPWLAVTLLIMNFVFAPFRKFAMGTLIVIFLLPILSWFVPGAFHITRSIALSTGYIALFLILVLRRLTAPRSEFADKTPTGELLLNRLLFDRDIRDRDTWVKRGMTSA
jgi:acyl phosphate:glycerol-3-phosphate acyltransferase